MQLQPPDPQTPWYVYMLYVAATLGLTLHIPVVKRAGSVIATRFKATPKV